MHRSCTIWGYNNVNALNIEYFMSNFCVIFEYSPRKWPMTQVQKESKRLMNEANKKRALLSSSQNIRRE